MSGLVYRWYQCEGCFGARPFYEGDPAIGAHICGGRWVYVDIRPARSAPDSTTPRLDDSQREVRSAAGPSAGAHVQSDAEQEAT